MRKFSTLFFLSVLFSAVISCENKAVNVEVQHDTLKTEKKAGAKDTVISNGEYIKHYENGVIEMRGMMKDGKREGVWKSWYLDGSPWSETTFESGKKNGKTTTWYDNENKRYEGFYTNDVESGTWTFWEENGKLIRTQTMGK